MNTTSNKPYSPPPNLENNPELLVTLPNGMKATLSAFWFMKEAVKKVGNS